MIKRTLKTLGYSVLCLGAAFTCGVTAGVLATCFRYGWRIGVETTRFFLRG